MTEDMATTGIGTHILADYWGCRAVIDSSDWTDALTRATEAMGATLLHLHVEPFARNGVTAMAVLAESHISIHTWPEHDYVAIDIFTCGEHVYPEKGIDVFHNFLCPAHEKISRNIRGLTPRGVPAAPRLA